MKTFVGILSGAAAAAWTLAAVGANPESKNVIDSRYGAEPEQWNACFRPYDPQFAEMLWSDSTLVRDVQLGAAEDARSVTAIASTCDETGFTVFVRVVEPKMNALMAEGAARPSNSLEVYFQAGDAEGSAFEPYYQFVCRSGSPTVSGVYPWLMEDRTFRSVKDYLAVDVEHRVNADVFRIRIPWEPLFDRLPWMKGKKDRLYRFNVIRWASTGGQTWGGNVHQMSNAGYVRFPDLDEKARTAIMKDLLVRAWDRYHAVLGNPRYSFDLLPVNSNMSFVRDEAKWPHTALCPAADRAFRDTVMKPMTERRGAFGAKIVDFEKLPYAEREAFYREAAPLLFNFEYDLLAAWGDWQEDLVFNEKKDYEYKLSLPPQEPPKDFAAALKQNDLPAAAKFADEMIAKAGRNVESVYARKILPALFAKKLSAADLVEKYCAAFAAFQKAAGKPVPFDTEAARLRYLDELSLRPRAELRREADAAIADVLAHPERFNARTRDRDLFRALSARAALFDGADYDRYRDEAEKLAGTNVAKRIECYGGFSDPERFMKDPLLTDVDRATIGYARLTNAKPAGKSVSFADREALLERVLKDASLPAEKRARALENLVALERSGLPRNWMGETPKRFNGTFTVSNPDPVAYAKAVAAQKELVALASAADGKLLMKRYVELLSLNYVALNAADGRATAAALEKALPALKAEWEPVVTGSLAAFAYFDEDYENAYRLFHRFTPAEYAGDGKDRARKTWWYTVAEPYVRTCVAMKQYDEAYLLQDELVKGMIESWESWHRAQYRSMFACLAKLCKPETLKK